MSAKNAILKKLRKILVPVLIIAAGGVAFAYFNTTKPVMKRTPKKKVPSMVQAITVHEKDVTTNISAMGTVVPSREVTLKSRVAGEVVSVSDHFIPGGHIEKGDVILSLDDSDLEIAVKKAESALADARAQLAIEEGNQNVAREEIRMLSELAPDISGKTDLALRKPQLMQAEAAVASAEADLRQARLDLSRSVIRAPFNALVIERSVNVGTYVNAQESLVTLVSTDEFWIEAVVPVDKLSLVDIRSRENASAIVRSQTGRGTWNASVVRVSGKLNETSRMATVILSVADPLGYTSGVTSGNLIIDDYVFVDISGRTLANVMEIPRPALQDNDTVWTYKDGVLAIRNVTVAWKNADSVFIKKGIVPGDKVIVSGISSPVDGMSLLLAQNDTENK